MIMVNLASRPFLGMLMTVPLTARGLASATSCAYSTSTASPTLKSGSGGRNPAILTNVRATASSRTAAITSLARLNWPLPLLRAPSAGPATRNSDAAAAAAALAALAALAPPAGSDAVMAEKARRVPQTHAVREGRSGARAMANMAV